MFDLDFHLGNTWQGCWIYIQVKEILKMEQSMEYFFQEQMFQKSNLVRVRLIREYS